MSKPETAYIEILHVLEEKAAEAKSLRERSEHGNDGLLDGSGFILLKQPPRAEVDIKGFGSVIVQPDMVVQVRDPNNPGSAWEGDHVAVYVRMGFKKEDGNPFVHPEDIQDSIAELGSRAEHDGPEDIYDLVLGPEMPPTIVQDVQLYEDPYLDGKKFQEVRKTPIDEQTAIALIGLVKAGQVDPWA